MWGGNNLCDGILCGEHEECQSGCCGSFVSFTHDRCLPILGDYCPGMDDSRIEYSHKDHHSHRHNDIMSNVSSSESSEENALDEGAMRQKAAAAREAMDRLSDNILVLAQEDNKSKRNRKR